MTFVAKDALAYDMARGQSPVWSSAVSATAGMLTTKARLPCFNRALERTAVSGPTPTTPARKAMCHTETAPGADESFSKTPDEGEPVTVTPAVAAAPA